QAYVTYGFGIVINMLSEVLPYMHIAKTEEMTIAEQKEVDDILGSIVQGDTPDEENGDTAGAENGEGEQAGENGEGGAEAPSGGGSSPSSGSPFYLVDPNTGDLIDPTTGDKAETNNNSEDSVALPEPISDGTGGASGDQQSPF
ncbi:MAG: peptidoglycan glycosyltransferase, partial [Lachnospiraceae bacterium]|nr:peptidoglycan glycosyltransferase [Lachnospiraceae bacterium]